ncbi:MAG TPA: DegV family protein [Lachnospiraceae bacterium]|nr:DegV family protein [Lachnospiraceae bacterium]
MSKKVAVLTDSNSGITQEQGKMLGIPVIPMPFYINDKLFYEDITLTQEQFYRYLEEDAQIHTSMPVVGDVLDIWNRLLKEYDEVVYIPMSSGLSSSCATAQTLAEDYDGRVQVVNNQRISVTQRQSVLDAMALAEQGWDAAQIKEYLEKTKFDSSIYIYLPTLKYLKKGGRVTGAAAALGTLLRIKPVLQIQGEKLDAFAKCRTVKMSKMTMLKAIEDDIRDRFRCADDLDSVWISGAYSGARDEEVEEWLSEVQAAYPGKKIVMQPLSLSISCHIGPGALAVTCTRKLPENPDENACRPDVQ